MASHRSFRILNARHVVSEDGLHVDLIDANRLTYGKPDRYVTLEAER